MARSYRVKEDYDKAYKDKNKFEWKYYSKKIKYEIKTRSTICNKSP